MHEWPRRLPPAAGEAPVVRAGSTAHDQPSDALDFYCDALTALSRHDVPFLVGTIPHVKRLADAFRAASRPVVYVAHILKLDYSDAAFPFWRLGLQPGAGNSTHCVEGTWGAEIIDELKPCQDEHLVAKKGFGSFANTQLDTVLRNLGVTTCVVTGVTTCDCVSNTVRGGVEHNYRTILVSDAVAEVSRETHEGELKTMSRVFADVKTTDEVLAMLGR